MSLLASLSSKNPREKLQSLSEGAANKQHLVQLSKESPAAEPLLFLKAAKCQLQTKQDDEVTRKAAATVVQVRRIV